MSPAPCLPAGRQNMDRYSTTTFGYKILSDNKINFYHVLLPKVSLESLSQEIGQVQKQNDGTITVAIPPSSYSLNVIERLVSFFEKKRQDFLDTPKQYYKIDNGIRQTLKSWALSFQGCIALLLAHYQQTKPLIGSNWQFINSQTGGLFLSPYTLFFYKNYPKIIHPVTINSYDYRKTIEGAAAMFVRRAVKRIADAQPGLEGQALLSLIEEQTLLSSKKITSIINEKSFGIQTPTHSPLFS